MINRRGFIATGASGLLLGGCDRLNNSQSFRGVLRSAEKLTMASQRLISPRDALAREYGEADLSPIFRSNGTAMPGAQTITPGMSPSNSPTGGWPSTGW